MDSLLCWFQQCLHAKYNIESTVINALDKIGAKKTLNIMDGKIILPCGYNKINNEVEYICDEFQRYCADNNVDKKRIDTKVIYIIDEADELCDSI